MTSPYEEIAAALKTIIDVEFAPEGFSAILDNLHESLGRKRVDIGIAPVEELPQMRDALVSETWVEVRFYDLWREEINPDTLVNPSRITNFAERFKRAVQTWNRTHGGTERVWYFDIRRIQFPNDPTGNKTRFHATIRAYGNNSALMETTG